MVREAFRPYAEYDRESDAVYVKLSSGLVASSKPLGDCRNVDYSKEGGVVGIEFLGVSGGIELSDIPFAQTVEQLIGDIGLGANIFA